MLLYEVQNYLHVSLSCRHHYYFSSNDTVSVKINIAHKEIIFLHYDNLFNEIDTININEIEVAGSFPSVKSNGKFTSTMVSNNLILSLILIDKGYYLYDRQGTIKARTTVFDLFDSDYDTEVYSDNNGYLYNYSRHTGNLRRYKIADW